MEALYDRMAKSIVESSESDRNMATKVLQSINCSHRALTVPDMAQILGEHRSDEAHLKASILAVCQGFITIDDGASNDGAYIHRVAMIHQTSREYLLDGEQRPFQVDIRAAHVQMFKSCMECLMDGDLKTKVRQKQTVVFLDYAATFWSLHLSFISTVNAFALDILKKFLTEQRTNKEWVLIWIHYLAANNRLKVLTHTSGHLLTYASKLKSYAAGEGTSKQAMELRELLGSWAVDLIKTAGKFGTVLLRNPRLIYKTIPPFCPHSSPMYQQFGKAQAKSLFVSGPSSMIEKWDDSLGRMTFGTREATSVSATGNQIAVLIPEGQVFLYDTSAFEQPAYGHIDHQDIILKMALNTTATLVATCGQNHTKVWEVRTGYCITSVPNPTSTPRPLTVIFLPDDRSLVVGFDDSEIRSLDIRQSSPTWQTIAVLEEKELAGHYLNVPNRMALNRDGTRLVVAYRGHPLSAWKLRPGKKPKHSGHCWRRGEALKRRGEVEDAVWHPRYKLVLGVYIDGIVFKWRPGFSDSISKKPRWEPKEITAGASKITLSRDGDIFAIGDRRGVIKVYTTIGFHLLYHLASQDTMMIGGLTFSPDMRRLYDTRGNYASAWEPTALIRWMEQQNARTDIFEGRSETSIAASSSVSINWSKKVDTITVIATPPSRHNLYCTATVGGGVTLHHTEHGQLLDIRPTNGPFGIDKMTLSRDTKYLCFTNSVKTLFIVSIDYDDKSRKTSVKSEAEISLSHVKGTILDLLFHQDATHILVQASSSVHSIALSSYAVERSLELDDEGSRWIQHPGDKTRIVGLSTSRARVIDWNLEIFHAYSFIPRRTMEDFDFENPIIRGKVDRLVTSSNGKYIVAQVSAPTVLNSQNKTLFYVEFSQFPSSKTESSNVNRNTDIYPTIMPEEISSQVATTLGFAKDNRLIFLSKIYSVCSWQPEFSQLGQQSPTAISPRASGFILDGIVSAEPSSESGAVDRQPSSMSIGHRMSSISEKLEMFNMTGERRLSGMLDERPLSSMSDERRMSSMSGVSEERRVSNISEGRRMSSVSTERPGSSAAGQKYAVKEIFPLPGDWISQDSLVVSTLWAREKSLLCPRNGEVMIVRSPDLRSS
jgi:WD40 repeat protein